MLAFIHTPKIAGVTVSLILRSSFGFKHCDVVPWAGKGAGPFMPDDLRRVCKLYPSLRSIAGHQVVPYVDLEEVCPGLRFFTLIREPVKRSASHYQFGRLQLGTDLTLEDWVETRSNLQTKHIARRNDVSTAIKIIEDKEIFVGLVERFDESMLLLKALVASDLNIAYAKMNVAKVNVVAENLLASKRARAMLAEANRADLELYNYVKRELYPMYYRLYGPRLNEDLIQYQENRGKFNRFNVFLSRLYRNVVYRPALRLYRRRKGSGTSEERTSRNYKSSEELNV